MNRSIFTLVALASLLALTPRPSAAQVPGSSTSGLVATARPTDDGPAQDANLRGATFDLRALRLWLSNAASNLTVRNAKAASRARRATAGRTPTWVP